MERIPEEVLIAYENSESCQALKKLRNESVETLMEYYQKYKDKRSEFQEEAVRKLDHERYGTESMLPRGRLCPGNMAALIVGNVKRGRMVKEYVNPGYVYGYDKGDNLITSDMVEGNIRAREYIFWENLHVQLGLQYGEILPELREITVVSYNEQGSLQEYLFGTLSDGKVNSLQIEKYEYEGEKVFVTYIDSFICDGDFMDGVHIVLYLDERGKVIKYTRCTDMNPEEVYEGIPKYKLVFSMHAHLSPAQEVSAPSFCSNS